MTDTASIEVSYSPTWRETGRAVARTPIARGSAWILASTVVAAAGGGLYWLAAAHTATRTEVGQATALFSSVAFVNYVTNLGLPVMVARFGGFRTRPSRVLFNWSLVITSVASAVVTLAYLPFLGHRADALVRWGSGPGVLFFAVVAAGGAICQLVDMRLTVQRRWGWVTGRIALYSIARFPLLLLAAHESVFLLFALAAGLPALSGFLAWWFADPSEGRFDLWPLPATAGSAARYSVINYMSQLALQAPIFVLPVFVLLAVPAKENAVFFVTWSIAVTVHLLPISVVRVLLAEGSLTQDLRRQTLVSLAVNGVIGLLAAAVAFVGADLVRILYGPGYAGGANLLPLLVSAVIPAGVTMVALTHARVINDEPATLWLSGLFAVTILVPSFVLIQSSGTMGAAQGWFAGNCVTGVVAGAWLLRSLRHAPSKVG